MKKLFFYLLIIITMCGCANNNTAKTIDVSPYLYKVSDSSGNYIYLLGTCHPGRDEVGSLDKTTEAAIDDSDCIVLECSLDPNEMAKYQSYLLENSIDELGLNNQLEEVLDLYPSLKGKHLIQYNAMAINSLALNDTLDEMDGNANNSIDNYLYKLTTSKDIPFEEMEGIEFQMKLFSSLSKVASPLILESLKYRDARIESSKLILDSYYNHDIDTLAKIYNSQDPSSIDYSDQLNQYQDLLIIDRNTVMQEKIINYLNQGKKAFIGVGVGHVVGDVGLLDSLAKQGYTVEQLG